MQRLGAAFAKVCAHEVHTGTPKLLIFLTFPIYPSWARQRRFSLLNSTTWLYHSYIQFGKDRAKEGVGPVTISMDIGYIKPVVSHAAAVHGVRVQVEPIAIWPASRSSAWFWSTGGGNGTAALPSANCRRLPTTSPAIQTKPWLPLSWERACRPWALHVGVRPCSASTRQFEFDSSRLVHAA